MHNKFSGARAYIPYATHMLQRRYTSTSNMLRRVQHVVYTLVHKKFLCMQKNFFFLTQTHMRTKRLILYVCDVRLTSLKRISDTYPTARCNEASFRLGKNFTSSDIRTWEHVIWSWKGLPVTSHFQIEDQTEQLISEERKPPTTRPRGRFAERYIWLMMTGF